MSKSKKYWCIYNKVKKKYSNISNRNAHIITGYSMRGGNA